MAEYSRAEMERMQAEAAERVREMHTKAQRSAGFDQTEPTSPNIPRFVQRPGNGSGNGRVTHEQNRAQGSERRAEGNRRADEERPRHAEPPRQEKSREPEKESGGFFGGGKGGFDIMKLLNFKNLEMDSDRTLVMMMMLLLSGENSDSLLTMALLYIMM